MSDIDPQEFGRLVEAVEHLSDQVEDLHGKLDKLQTEHNSLVNRGQGFLAGAALLVGGSATAAWKIFGG